MSVGTVLGFLFGFGLFFSAIFLSTNNYVTFISLPSFLMVTGGTIASAFISFRARYVWLAFRGIGKILTIQPSGREYLQGEVAQMVVWGYLVRRDGLVALEHEINSSSPNDHFSIYAINMVVTGYRSDEVREMLTGMVEAGHERDMVNSNILRYMGATAPAFGMIGTLVGLVIMLENIGGDPGALGQGLAVALVTTLYGVLMARLIFLPAANKTQQNLEIQRFRNYLMLEGFVMLADERSPRFIQDRLNAALDPTLHYDVGGRGHRR